MNSERWDPNGGPGIRGPAGVAQGGYAMWVAWIEAFRRGEDRDTTGLPSIDGGMGSYVEARLLERLSAAFSERVRQWQSVVGERIVAAPPVDEVAVTALLRDAAPGLEPLARVAGSPLLPRAMSLAMHDLLGQVRAGARDAVEESSRRAREPAAEPRVPRVTRRPPNGPVPTQRSPDGGRPPRLPGGPGRTASVGDTEAGVAHPVVPSARTRR
ncbi:hypothetical protein LQ327_02745 [Actinomycetospora endophytica]|uniref:Uncharacterized protein n=1 Tax=Actinomycetospora endophytica TaxID=2291215 RepID=A0ABS8P258_9PSEU|nr:hypothetical protein [Actinomycetospora endophytica]MCD2192314.1 hypothetical protein [Actinomycetospora endophytica]